MAKFQSGHSVSFAVRDGKTVHIDDVESGLACESICFECGEKMVARKGTVKRHHFAHYSSTTCNGGGESLIHRIAKEVLLESKTLVTPAYIHRHSKSFSKIIQETKTVNFDCVSLEVDMIGYRVDAVGYVKNKKLAVEIVYTHAPSVEKIKAFQEMGIPAIQINIDALDLLSTKIEYHEQVVLGTSNKTWLSNPRFYPQYLKAGEELDQAYMDYTSVIEYQKPKPGAKRKKQEGAVGVGKKYQGNYH